MNRLTVFSKIVIFAAIIAVSALALSYFDLFNSGTRVIGSPLIPATQNPGGAPAAISNDGVYDSAKLLIAIDEWHGWKPVVDANGGLDAAKTGSIFWELGLDVEIEIINEDEESLQKFINGEVQAVGQSINEWPYVHARLQEMGVNGKMVIITDKSVGGDGIVTTADITGIEGLAGHTIVLAKNSAAHAMTEWLLKQSNLSDEQIDEIRANMIFTESTDEAYDIFAEGEADAATLWEPYISQASSVLGAKVLFSTKSAANLMIDGIVFREDYLEQYPQEVEKFIEGTLRAMDEYAGDFSFIREFEDYEFFSDGEIEDIEELVAFTNYADNKELFAGMAQTIYSQMADIWDDLGEKIVRNGSQSAFANSFLLNLEPKFPDAVAAADLLSNINVSEINTEMLLQQALTINFERNVAIITPDSYPALAEFAQTAKILAGSLIQVEGNIADTGVGDTTSGRQLSLHRAEAVCNYLIELGIDESRLIAKGNGITNPVPGLNPRSEEGMLANRRTDIFFLMIE